MTLKKGDNTLTKSTIFLEILRRIPEKSYITLKQIGRELKEAGYKVEPRTLQRYLDRISATDAFQIEVDTRTRPYGYRKLSKLNSIVPQKLGAIDYLLLKLAQEHMRYQMPPKLTLGLKPLFDQAASFMSGGNPSAEKDWLKKVVCVSNALEFEPPRIRIPVFEAVSEALFDSRVLEVKYRKAGDEKVKKSYIHPLGLVQQDVRIYLVCRFQDYEDVRTLALNRIDEAKVMQEKALTPKGFDLKNYVKREQSFNYDKNRWIKLSFEFTNPVTKQILEETPFLGKSQTIEKIAKSKWKLTAVLRDSRLLDGWLAMWKDEAGMTNVKREAVKGD